MNSAIKIIKRGTSEKPNNVSTPPDETRQQRERNTASTIKRWVAEWQQRKRSLVTVN